MAAMRTRYMAGISGNTVLLAFASLFADISSEILYPILPVFLTEVLHASESVVGVVEGIAEATQNLVQGFSGWLSDKLQKRKTLTLIGYFVSALGRPLMGIATAWPGVLERSLHLRGASDYFLFVRPPKANRLRWLASTL